MQGLRRGGAAITSWRCADSYCMQRPRRRGAQRKLSEGARYDHGSLGICQSGVVDSCCVGHWSVVESYDLSTPDLRGGTTEVKDD